MDKKRPLAETVFEITISALMAVLWGAFVYDNVTFLKLNGYKLSVWLVILKGSTDVVFTLFRRFPKATSLSPYSWIVAMLGAVMVLFLRPSPTEGDNLVGQVIQCLGLLLQLAAIFSLNRSFGIVPANRGIKTGGMYRYLRHPLYGTYLLGQVGFLINNLTAANMVVVVTALILQIARIFEEEKFLMNDEAYREYAAKTRWRLIPFVF